MKTSRPTTWSCWQKLLECFSGTRAGSVVQISPTPDQWKSYFLKTGFLRICCLLLLRKKWTSVTFIPIFSHNIDEIFGIHSLMLFFPEVCRFKFLLIRISSIIWQNSRTFFHTKALIWSSLWLEWNHTTLWPCKSLTALFYGLFVNLNACFMKVNWRTGKSPEVIYKKTQVILPEGLW